MKLSKRVAEKLMKNGFKIVLPRLAAPVPKSSPRKTIKRNAKKTYRLSTRSTSSNKENECLPVISPSQPKLSLIKIDKALNINLSKNCPPLKLSEKDRKLIQATLTNGKSSTYSQVDTLTIKSSETEREGTISKSAFAHVSHSSSGAAGTSHSENSVEVRIVTPSQKAENGYVPRKTGQRVLKEIQKPRVTRKRKLQDLFDQIDDDGEPELDEPTNTGCSNPVNETPNHRDVNLKNIMKTYSSHSCNDRVDREINNTQVTHIPDGFVRKNFVIRIKQFCQDKPAVESVPEQSTSVISNTTQRENFKKNAKKTRKSITIEKTIGINLHTRTGNREKQCTNIVQSKYKETIEKSNAAKKPIAPSEMVTRRRAAASKQNNHFFSLTNKKKLLHVEQSNSVTQDVSSESSVSTELPFKLLPFKIVLKKGFGVSLENEQESTNTENKKTKNDEPTPSTSKSMFDSERKNADRRILNLNKTPVNSNRVSEPRILEIALDSQEAVNQLRKTTVKTVEFYKQPETKRGPGRPRKLSSANNQTNSGYKKSHRKRGRPKKPNDDEDYNPKKSYVRKTAAKSKRGPGRPRKLKTTNSESTNFLTNSVENHPPRDVMNEIPDPRPNTSGLQKSLQKNHHFKKLSGQETVHESTGRGQSQKLNKSGHIAISCATNNKNHLIGITNEALNPGPSTSQFRDSSFRAPNSSINKENKNDIAGRAKKRMKKDEANKKTEEFNERRRTSENNGRHTRSRTKIVTSTNAFFTKTIVRHSSRTQNEKNVNAITSVADGKRYPLGVTFSTETPETIPRLRNRNKCVQNDNFSPCVLLDKLDATDISTYAITPLREDREPLPSKSAVDYGIDDVNTDDSTDDEERPKKMIPEWAKSIADKPVMQFYVPRQLITSWIRPPKVRFTAKALFT